jgi:hypothetical protein
MTAPPTTTTTITTKEENPTMTTTELPLPTDWTAGPPTTPRRPHAGQLPAVLRSEWIKFTTVRTNKVILAVAVALGLLTSWASAVFVTDQALTVADVYIFPTLLTSVLAAIAGVLLFTSEVQHGTLALRAARPRRRHRRPPQRRRRVRRAGVVAGRREPRHPVRPSRGRAAPALRHRLPHARNRIGLRLGRDRRICPAEPGPRRDLLGLRRLCARRWIGHAAPTRRRLTPSEGPGTETSGAGPSPRPADVRSVWDSSPLWGNASPSERR